MRRREAVLALVALVEQDFLSAMAHGLGDKDSTAAVTVQEDRAGVKVRT